VLSPQRNLLFAIILQGCVFAQMFFAGLSSAIAIKLTSSVDDVLWLAPFLTSNVNPKARVQNGLVYIGVCVLQTAVAMIIASSGNAAVALLTQNRAHAWSADKILTMTAGVLLTVYTGKLTYEYFFEDEDDKDEDVATSDSEAASAEVDSKESESLPDMELGPIMESKIPEDGKENSNRSEKAALLLSGAEQLNIEDLPRHISAYQETSADSHRTTCKADKTKKQSALFVIAFIGSMDDLTLFVPMLVGKGFDFMQLICGAVIAACTIVMMCIFLGSCKPVADCLARIPLALIVAVFAATLLCKGFVMQ